PYKGKNLICEPCDILLPCALEKLIKKDTAQDIKAKIIAEGASGPITPAGDKVLIAKNVLIPPDLITIAGGITVSYYEWLKNLNHTQDIKAKIIAEGASGPITPAGDKVLIAKNVLIPPDLITIAGGITVSYYEWLKNLNHTPFGRLSYKYERDCNYLLLQSVQEALQRYFGQEKKITIPIVPSELFKRRIYGAGEKEIIRNGLMWTMENSCKELMKTAKEFNLGTDFRTAGYVYAIQLCSLSNLRALF
ncbi:Glutamate/Leucine/Phenylalanine/Valine dehydrogenase, partial [Popillia japonica]